VLEAFLAVRGHGTALLVASHDERVIEVADRTVRLDEGRVVS
jgi:ABC-type ATPase involved in cell division